MKKEDIGVLCVDVSLIPLDAEIFFKILLEHNTIFYDSRLNTSALPPYAILGKRGNLATLDLANKDIQMKFDLLVTNYTNNEKKKAERSSDNDNSSDKSN